MDEKYSIRTSTGPLFGSFDTREEAWEAIKRVRKSGHDALDVATVVPLLAGVTPKPMHPAWLSDDYIEPDSKPHYTPADVDALVKRAAELVTELEQTRAERDRFREHSVTLNSVSFAMAQALGDVPPGADQVEGNPVEQVARLIVARDQCRAESGRLGDHAQRLVNVANEARERANEAARLSAAARDDADHLRKKIDDLNEHLGIVEGDRMALTVERDALQAALDRRTAELDEAYAEVERLTHRGV